MRQASWCFHALVACFVALAKAQEESVGCFVQGECVFSSSLSLNRFTNPNQCLEFCKVLYNVWIHFNRGVYNIKYDFFRHLKNAVNSLFINLLVLVMPGIIAPVSQQQAAVIASLVMPFATRSPVQSQVYAMGFKWDHQALSKMRWRVWQPAMAVQDVNGIPMTPLFNSAHFLWTVTAFRSAVMTTVFMGRENAFGNHKVRQILFWKAYF